MADYPAKWLRGWILSALTDESSVDHHGDVQSARSLPNDGVQVRARFRQPWISSGPHEMSVGTLVEDNVRALPCLLVDQASLMARADVIDGQQGVTGRDDVAQSAGNRVSPATACATVLLVENATFLSLLRSVNRQQ